MNTLHHCLCRLVPNKILVSGQKVCSATQIGWSTRFSGVRLCNFDHKWMFEIICQSTQTKYPFVDQGWRPRPTEEMSRFSRGFGSDLVSILGSGSNLDFAFAAAAVAHEMKNALVCHDRNRLFMSMDNASNLAPVAVVQMARVCLGIG